MTDEQIAHDLAIAKLYGSTKDTKEVIKAYRKYYDEVLSELKAEHQKPKTAKIMQNPF